MNLFQRLPGAAIVKAQPTFEPQARNAMSRLERALRNDWNDGRWQRADVRKIRPPEPYKGKGIRYVGEYVRRKAGKAGKATH